MSKKKPTDDEVMKNLGIAANKWNKMTQAQKKAARNWGPKNPPPKQPWWKKIL